MRKALILSLAVVLSLGMFAGCAASAKNKGPADPELIQKTLDQWKEAGVAKDVSKAMPLYSEKFKSPEYGDKAGLKTFLQDAFGAGYLKNLEVDTASAKTAIDSKKGTASVSGIDVKARFGAATIDLELAKEGGNWLITGMTVKEN
jgi:hypothetical protein